MHQNSDTQTQAGSQHPKKNLQKTEKKREKKRKISFNEQTPNNKNIIKKSKINKTDLYQYETFHGKTTTVLNTPEQKVKWNNCITHTSVFQKLALSFVLSIISITLFTEIPPIDYPLAHFQQGTHQPVFQILTDRKTRYITFNIEKSENLLFGLKSTKSAKIKAGVKYNLGYKFKSKNFNSFDSSGLVAKNSPIEMSDLMILQYSIQNVTLINRQDGYFNLWDFEDHQSLVNFVNDKYIKSMQQETLASITDERRKIYEKKAKFMLTQMIDRSQSWFNWLLKRVDTYLQVGLHPYLQNIQILYKQTSKQQNQPKKKI